MPDGEEPRAIARQELKQSFLKWLAFATGREPGAASGRDWFMAVALALRERIVGDWIASRNLYREQDCKRVYYLSLEFLVGRLMSDSMANLGIMEDCREVLDELGVHIDDIVVTEPDAALGNGGLGRLAACFMDSMATLGIPGYGYGIRYQYGLFRQQFDKGWQVEAPEDWLAYGNPWELERPDISYPIDFYGHVHGARDDAGRPRWEWRNTQRVLAMAYDTPVVGWGGRSINTLRLWAAKPVREFSLDDFNRGDYLRAVEQKALTENLSWVLYPNDSTPMGQELRFKQEYFFTSASLQDMLRRFLGQNDEFARLPDHAAVQLNDTHPAIAVAELMRLLIDLHALDWDEAWDITTRCLNYTNHTLLPEALERWPVALFERVLPRHLQLIYDINDRFLKSVAKRAGSDLRALSLIDEDGPRSVRMGNLAFIGSRRVNGVSALHTELMKKTVFKELHKQFPDRIVNMTNGITPRRWLNQCNRPLATLITDTIGDGWIADLPRLAALEPLADDAAFRQAFADAKAANKRRLAQYLETSTGVAVDPDALFDVQVKRIHEYKRQLLNLLQTVALYNEMRDDPGRDWLPRVKVMAGKAAPSYGVAKLIIKLANDIGTCLNRDPVTADRLKFIFVPNYNVGVAEIVIPAADLSEQISTAGMEASGTGNMKLALNGALTIGTLDGANVEIRERVGPENIFIFGLTADEAAECWRKGYDSHAAIEADPRLARALEMIAGGFFSPDDPGRFRPLVDALFTSDRFLVTADFGTYWTAQKQAETVYRNRDIWWRRAVLNTANVGWFSSDRTVQSYAAEIWRTLPQIANAAQ